MTLTGRQFCPTCCELLPLEWVMIPHVLEEGCLAIHEACKYVQHESRGQKAAGPHTARSARMPKFRVSLFKICIVMQMLWKTTFIHVYLVWDLKVFSSPYLQPRVIQAQLKEEVSFNGKETTGHSWRPTHIQTLLLWKATSNIKAQCLFSPVLILKSMHKKDSYYQFYTALITLKIK